MPSFTRRDDGDRQTLRNVTYNLLRRSFDKSGMPPLASHWDDRGDGVLIVVPPTVPTSSVAGPVLTALADGLEEHNGEASETTRLQLRIALDVGPVTSDELGASGECIIRVARLQDAPAFKQKLAETGAEIGMIVSDFVYDRVIRHGSGQMDLADFRRVSVSAKGSDLNAWIWAGQSRETQMRTGQATSAKGKNRDWKRRRK